MTRQDGPDQDAPGIDDRSFEDLREEALRFVASRGGEWNDLGPGDPGLVLLEAFAYLTDVLLYRVNRLPQAAHREFLGLLGMAVRPPAAAHVDVAFRRDEVDAAVTVSAGTWIGTGEGGRDELRLLLRDDVILAAGAREAVGRADHVRQISDELLGTTTGRPAETFRLAHAPVVRATGHELDLFIGVEIAEGAKDRVAARVVDGRAYARWDVVEAFAGQPPASRMVRVDRATGLVTFPPAGLGAPVSPGRKVRAWYRVGGGTAGNVAAGTLTTMTPPVDGIEAVNPARAVGGEDAEPMSDALARAGSLFHEPRRAVTADDVEALARSVGGVSRAIAVNEAEHWVHAAPGTVEVRLVGRDPRDTTEQPTAVLEQVRDEIERRQPLGSRCVVRWAGEKRVTVGVRVVVDRAEDRDAVRARVAQRLHDALSPVPTEESPRGWEFGQALRASNVYDIALREAGVRYADSVTFEVEETPGTEIATVVADRHQPRTWYLGDGPRLFRSQNDGVGWERLHQLDGATVTRIVTSDDRPGAVALIADGDDRKSSRLHVSGDCGSSVTSEPVVTFTWSDADAAQHIRDVCWLPEDHADDLLIATDRGLFRMRLGDPAPRPWVVDREHPGRGCWAVVAAPDANAGIEVAVAMQDRGGVWLAVGDAEPMFARQALAEADVRRLVIERRGLRRFLWAPTFAVGDDPGTGCHRAELLSDGTGSWTHLALGWNGGICHDLAFLGDRVLAATQFNGVLVRDGADPAMAWRSPSVESSGLPLTEARRFHPVMSIDAGPGGALAGTDRGVLATTDGTTFRPGARRVHTDTVTIPPTWVFGSGAHRVEVVSDDMIGDEDAR